MRHTCTAFLLAFTILMTNSVYGKDVVRIENRTFRLEFDVNGRPKSLFRLSDQKELLNSADPGRGFYLYGLDFISGPVRPNEIPLQELSFDGKRLVVAEGLAKLTFAVNVQDSYLSFSLERVEGVPAQNLLTLRFELNVVENIAMHPLDHMTYQRNCYGATDGIRYSEDAIKGSVTRQVFWSWLWDRNPDNPFGAFALQCPRNDAEHDETLLQIWVHEESLPKPAIKDKWTVARAKAWLEGWLEFVSDIRSVTIHGKNVAELRELVDFAKKENLNQIKLFTHTWRGGFWPYKRNHLIPNPEIFPGGMNQFREFCDYLTQRDMRLELHTLSMSISNADPYWVKTPEGPDPRLAHWLRGELVKPMTKQNRTLYLRPEPGSSLPTMVPSNYSGPKSLQSFFNISTISIGKEFIQIDEFQDTDKDVWTLIIGRRGMFESETMEHAQGEKVVGYTRPYGQCFTADSNSSLLVHLAREFGEFCNDTGVDHVELDGLEVHGKEIYGPAKFSRLLYRYLDHFTTSNSSSGGIMPFHMEYWFKAAPRGKKSWITMPLHLERTGRRATNPYEVHVEVARFVAERNVSVGGLTKPEPMFDLTKDMLATHGLSDRFREQLGIWREVSKRLTDDQRATIAGTYRPMGRERFGNRSHHKESDFVYEPRMIDNKLAIVPLSMLTRQGIDRGWGTGQEFGPICVWQFVKVGENVVVQNRFAAQEPEFVIHVMPALVNKAIADKSAATGNVDTAAEGYDIGAGLEKSLTIKGLARDLILQPDVTQIRNLGDHTCSATKNGLKITYDNKRDEPYTDRDNIPHWKVKANSNNARGIGLTVTGDGSGAVLLIQLKGRGFADYIVPLDFKGTREIVIPNGTASWTDENWFWTMDVKKMQHEYPIGQVGLALGHVPPGTKATATVSNLRLLAEEAASLLNPTLMIGKGSLQITGTIQSDHYIWYTGGDSVGVYDLNWNEVARLPVKKDDFIAPGKGADIVYQILSEGKDPFPQLGVEIFTAGKPMAIQ